MAKSRERAARSARETAQARERWKVAKEITKKRATGLQKQLSRTFSRKTQGDQAKNLNQSSANDTQLPPKFPSASAPSSGAPKAKKDSSSLTKMLQSLENDPDGHGGFHMEIGDKNIKKQALKAKQ